MHAGSRRNVFMHAYKKLVDAISHSPRIRTVRELGNRRQPWSGSHEPGRNRRLGNDQDDWERGPPTFGGGAGESEENRDRAEEQKDGLDLRQGIGAESTPWSRVGNWASGQRRDEAESRELGTGGRDESKSWGRDDASGSQEMAAYGKLKGENLKVFELKSEPWSRGEVPCMGWLSHPVPRRDEIEKLGAVP